MGKVLCVTGTPGTGKTELCYILQQQLQNVLFVNIGDLIREKELYSEWDDEMNCSIFDEKLVSREISKIVRKRNVSVVLDFHSIGFIKSSLVDRVIVLQTDTNVLWKRLENRKYDEKKIKENVEAEIFMESFNEAIDQFGEEKVQLCVNNTPGDRDVIITEICAFFTSQ